MVRRVSDDTRQSVVGVRGITSIPILGALFRSNDYHRRKESELIILVTPYVATHAAKADFAGPDKGFCAVKHPAGALSRPHQPRSYGVMCRADTTRRLRLHCRISGRGG